MATTQQIIAQQNNTNPAQVASSNPQANVSSVQQGIAPVTIPVQIQPVVQQAQTQQAQVQPAQTQPAQQQPAQNSQLQVGQVQVPQAVQQTTQPNTNIQSLFPQVSVPNEDVTGMDSYKSQYSDAINQIANNILNMRFSYNPDEDDLLQQATNYVTQNTYESMNSKGILNSSMTAERVAKVVGDLIPQYEKMAREEFEASFSRMINMANLIMNMDDRSFTIWKDARDQRWKEQEAEYEKKQKEIQNAWNKVDQLGYVDNESALLLNIPAGTLSKDAREAKEKFERENEEWERRHKIETETEKELIQLKLEMQDDIDARQEARQYKYDLGLLDRKAEIEAQQQAAQQEYDIKILKIKEQITEAQSQRDFDREKELLKEKNRLTKENDAQQHQYDIELLNIKDQLQEKQDARDLQNEKDLLSYKAGIAKEQTDYDTEKEKDLLKYKSDLAVDEYNTKTQIDNTYQNTTNSSTSSSKGLVSLSNYDAIIKNSFATKQNGQYIVTNPDALINYLKQEYESGRLSETDALTLIAKYNLSGVAGSTSTSSTQATRKPYYIASTGEMGYGAAY